MTRHKFCAVVPVYRTGLSEDEQLSLRHLDHYLPGAHKYLLMPDSLDFRRPDYRCARFPQACFRDVAAYNHLTLSKDLYARFHDYEFVLIHQLDAIIFSSGIEPFLEMGVDYLGAPWVEHDTAGGPRLVGVGNGGLSLRRVSAFRRLLASRVRTMTPREYYRFRGYSGRPAGRRLLGACRSVTRLLPFRNSLRHELSGGIDNEDWFIAAEAARYSPGFVLASIPQALEFAFEEDPGFCLEQAGGRLPFGAHAWARYDRAFWEPSLLD